MTVKLLTEHQLQFLSLKGGCAGSSESTLVKVPHCWKSCAGSSESILVKMPYCWKSHVAVHMFFYKGYYKMEFRRAFAAFPQVNQNYII